jgi:hypothetical protein
LSIQLQDGTGAGTLAKIDANKNVMVSPGLAEHPSAGGYYSVGFETSAVVAAALAANTLLASLRFNPSSTRKAYIDRVRLLIGVATVGASAGVAGTLAWQRFTAVTPTGGTAFTPNELNEPLATASDMTDIRANNAALTGAPTFGAIVAVSLVPLFITSGAMWMEWVVDFPYPVVLQPGDGLALRNPVAMAATQTWMYSGNVYWHEQ